MVFDVSSLYSERRVIQNAADSSVLATVQECAIGGLGSILNVSASYPSEICGTQAYAQEFASKYANFNSPDSLTKVEELCGKTPLAACNGLGAGLYECKTINPAYKNYVRIKTNSQTAAGNSITTLFTSLTNPNDATITLKGCAQAAWGKAAFAPVFFPLALPICDYSISGTKLISDFSSNTPIVVGGCTITDLNGDVFNYVSPTKGFDLLTGFGCPGITPERKVLVGDTLQIESSLTQLKLNALAVLLFSTHNLPSLWVLESLFLWLRAWPVNRHR